MSVPLSSPKLKSFLSGFPLAQMVKNLPAMQETWVRSLGQEDTLEKEMATHSSILPGKRYRQRSLVGYSPRGHKRVRNDLGTKQQATS